jgi:hypothetical protein
MTQHNTLALADNLVSIELQINPDDLHQLMLTAHQQDITLNQLVEQLLWNELDRRRAAQLDLFEDTESHIQVSEQFG